MYSEGCPHVCVWQMAVRPQEMPAVLPMIVSVVIPSGVSYQAEEGGDEYGGAKPFSEPETRIVRLLAETSRPQVSNCPSMPVIPAGSTAVACG